MNENKQLSTKWLKASVVGTLWASSEIILGSFLHNLKIPFTGNVLTSVGIVLLVSMSYLWKEKGLFWRAGLICALMKTISPSAIIFGPMIAIVMEGFLMEFSIRVFGRNILGLLMAGTLAMSWNVFHRIFNYLISYGFNIVDLYEFMVKFAQKQLNIKNEIFWLPIIVLFSINIIWGLLASSMGIIIGKKASKSQTKPSIINLQKNEIFNQKNNVSKINYSLGWLFFSIIAMISVLVLMNFFSWIWWVSASVVITAIWIFKYKSAMKPLKKVNFWVMFCLISFLSSYLFYEFTSVKKTLFDAFLIGLQMNLRAAVLMIGFLIIGKELYNPIIINFFHKSYFKKLYLSVETAFDTLPFVMSNIPKFKEIIKHPYENFKNLVSQADFWLDRLIIRQKNKSNVIIISGEVGEGKTTLAKKIISELQNDKYTVSGIISESVIENNKRIGYDLLDISTTRRIQMAREAKNGETPNLGRFCFYSEAFEFGEFILKSDSTKKSNIIVIDEVSFLELRNEGWTNSINEIIKETETPLILAVRTSNIQDVIQYWNFGNPLIVNAANKDIEIVKKNMYNFLKFN